MPFSPSSNVGRAAGQPGGGGRAVGKEERLGGEQGRPQEGVQNMMCSYNVKCSIDCSFLRTVVDQRSKIPWASLPPIEFHVGFHYRGRPRRRAAPPACRPACPRVAPPTQTPTLQHSPMRSPQQAAQTTVQLTMWHSTQPQRSVMAYRQHVPSQRGRAAGQSQQRQQPNLSSALHGAAPRNKPLLAARRSIQAASAAGRRGARLQKHQRRQRLPWMPQPQPTSSRTGCLRSR